MILAGAVIGLFALGRAAYPGAAQGAAPDKPADTEVQPISPLKQRADVDTKEFQESSKARGIAQAEAFDALQKRILAAIDELKRDGKRRYLEVEDLILDGAAYADQDIATVGLTHHSRYQGYVDIVNAISAVPVRVSELPAAEKAMVEAFAGSGEFYQAPRHAVIVKGKLKGSAAQGYHVESSACGDLGLVPEFGTFPIDDLTLSQLRRGRSKVYDENVLARREKLSAVIQELEGDGRYPYVEIEDLLINRGKYLGRDIATIGMPRWEEGYVRTPYFDMTAGYGDSRNGIPIQMARLPLETRKELLRNQYPPHLVVIKGKVAAEAGGYYLAASGYADVFQSRDSPDKILKPNLAPLAPFDGNVKKFRQKASYGAVSEAERLGEIDEFRDKLLAAIAALRKDAKFAYEEIEDLGLDPAAYLERDIVTIGVPAMVDVIGSRPHFDLANKSFGEISMPVLMSGFSPEMKKEIVRLEIRNVIAVRGRLKRSADQRYYLDASGYSDLGEPPPSEGTHIYISDMLKGREAYNSHRASPAMEKKIQDAISELKRDGRFTYVAFPDLLRSPGASEGRDIATLGVLGGGVAEETHPNFELYEKWDSYDPIPVIVSQLPLPAKKALFRIMHEDNIIIKGRLRAWGEKKYYLEATDYTDLGPFPMSHVRKE